MTPMTVLVVAIAALVVAAAALGISTFLLIRHRQAYDIRRRHRLHGSPQPPTPYRRGPAR